MWLLVIDDNEVNREAMAKLLRMEGHEVETMDTAIPALALMGMEKQTRVPDGIILDQLLPGMEGMQLIRSIRKHPTWKDVSIVLLTADVAAPDPSVEEEINDGISHSTLLIKPTMDIQEILGALEKLRSIPSSESRDSQ